MGAEAGGLRGVEVVDGGDVVDGVVGGIFSTGDEQKCDGAGGGFAAWGHGIPHQGLGAVGEAGFVPGGWGELLAVSF